MDNPRIIARTTLSEDHQEADDGTTLDLRLIRQWEIGVNDLQTKLLFELSAAAKDSEKTIRFKRDLSAEQTESVLRASKKLKQFVQMRESMMQRTKDRDVEFSIEINPELTVTVIEHANDAPSFGIRATSADQEIDFSTTDTKFEGIKGFLSNAQDYFDGTSA